jgi:hypothetical protein
MNVRSARLAGYRRIANSPDHTARPHPLTYLEVELIEVRQVAIDAVYCVVNVDGATVRATGQATAGALPARDATDSSPESGDHWRPDSAEHVNCGIAEESRGLMSGSEAPRQVNRRV